MKFNKRYLITIVVALFLGLGIGLGTRINAQTVEAPRNPMQSIPSEDIQRFATAIAEIKQFYIEPVTDDSLFGNAIKGMLSNLDPHSAYLDSNDLRDLQTVTTGKFGGIGIEVMPENGFIRVISPLDDTPASRAGMKPGDLIVRIDNKLVKDMTMEQAINMIRGPKGSKITLTVVRKGENKPKQMVLTREAIKVDTVKYRLLDNSYGYARISFFQASAKPELDKAIKAMQKQAGGSLKGLVLDLRNNPGGLLDSAIEVSDEFLDANKLGSNKLIVYTKGRIPGADIQAKAVTNGDVLAGAPMVILINGGSASASEIVAGALQDHKRAIIMGTRSFGKGSVQTVIPLDNKTAIKLTTALYYTPSGRSIQAKGIEPDVIVKEIKFPKNDNKDEIISPLQEADLNGHLKNGNPDQSADDKSAKPAANPSQPATSNGEDLDSLTNGTAEQKSDKNLAQQDFQLYEALNLLKGLHASKTVIK